MKQILAFGDSNTWGLIPGTVERYPEHIRWTGILRKAAARYGYGVLEDGVCGRTTVFQDPVRSGCKGLDAIAQYQDPGGISAVVLMLGTNDCKKAFRAAPEKIGRGLEQCIAEFEKSVVPERILVCSPVLLGKDVWRPEKDPAFDDQSIRTCSALKEIYKAIAAKRGNLFLAASEHAEACSADEEHMNAEGHEKFGNAVWTKLRECLGTGAAER